MTRIPKILHFCFGMKENFGGKPWGLSHYVCVKSAIEKINPQHVNLYYEFEPSGPWWDEGKKLFNAIKVNAPQEVFGRPVSHPAHRADVLRLQKLIELGGIYLDADVLVQRDFDDLLEHSVVMGAEGKRGRFGIANAVILSEPHAPFLEKWFEEYKTFRGDQSVKYWNEHSVKLPRVLASKYPDEITVLPYKAFFWPLWTEDHIRWLFDSDKSIDLSETYGNHLWERKAWRYLKDLTPGEVRRIDTNFHRWSRPYVSHLEDDFGASASEVRGRRGPDAVEVMMEMVKLNARRIKMMVTG